MLLKNKLLSLTACIFLFSCSFLQKASVQKKITSAQVKGNTPSILDTAKKTVAKIKPYKEVITEKAITTKGLFKVHKVEDRYFFEIPDSLLDKDFLIVNRISTGAAENRIDQFLSYAGDEIGENEVQFTRGGNNKLFIRLVSYLERSKDSSANGMYRSLQTSTFRTIAAAFDIKAFSPDSAGIVIDMTDYLAGDNDVFFFDTRIKKRLRLGALQADRSYIERIQSFPKNLEIRTVKTYPVSSGDYAFTYELNSSLVLLPNTLMRPRYADERVGYFATAYRDLDKPAGADGGYMITRWRLEPRPEDVERYKKGELVEPQKPIIYYIDPTTPKKWVPYLIQGVNDWQKVFEKAGFKHAIYALEAPVNDTEWNINDARHNVFVYKPSPAANAYGPQVNDPRTGEILESHIGWFHSVTKLLHDWYMIQAGAIDPKARKMEFDDSLMGQLIRFVSSHEVGHTLGLRHNFGASSTVPVDSLRSKKWVETNGHTPSIMDYARFNYVAQPEDSIGEIGIFPRIGVYDEWAIEWGYRWLPDLKDPDAEKAFMNHWIIDRTGKDKRLWFGDEGLTYDPRCQSEDLGDNAMKAGYYGIRNLKIVLSHLIEWTSEPNNNYEKLYQMQKEVMAQFKRYLFHVVRNIGAEMNTFKTIEQPGPVYEFVPRERQKEAVRFLQEQLFNTPEWIFNKDIFALVEANGYSKILPLQKEVLSAVMSLNNLGTLLYFEANHPAEAYTPMDLLQDLKAGIFRELKERQPIDLYRRNLQKAYIAQLAVLQSEIGETPEKRYTNMWGNTDVLSILKAHIQELLNEVTATIGLHKDQMSKIHLTDLRDRLKLALDIGIK